MKRGIVWVVLLILAFTVGFLVGERQHYAARLRTARQLEYSRITNERQARVRRDELERRLEEIVRKMDAARR
jgi:hypothetical protein